MKPNGKKEKHEKNYIAFIHVALSNASLCHNREQHQKEFRQQLEDCAS